MLIPAPHNISKSANVPWAQIQKKPLDVAPKQKQILMLLGETQVAIYAYDIKHKCFQKLV